MVHKNINGNAPENRYVRLGPPKVPHSLFRGRLLKSIIYAVFAIEDLSLKHKSVTAFSIPWTKVSESRSHDLELEYYQNNEFKPG